MKKIFFLILAFCLLLVGCDINELPNSDRPIEEPTPTPDVTKSQSVQVEILQMNDIHGHIENEGSYGGLGRASYLINQIRNETKEDNTVLLANGDMLQETAISRVGYGKVVIDAMNEMQFDMMGVGNHEFDWGFSRFLEFFDGDTSNGEANFPLVNSNIYFRDSLVTGEKVCESLLLEKEDVKVGIVSYIGNVYSSINANMTIDYTFKARAQEITDSVETLAISLKKQGADIILVNIHDGEPSSCLDYAPNLMIANLKLNGEYLVDAVINGHTHTRQDALIKRTGGTEMPVIQSAGKLADFGRIDLTYDTKEKQVTQVKVSHIKTNSTSIVNSKVEKIINDHYNMNRDILEEVYCKNINYIDRYSENLYEYISNVMLAGTNATAAICNTGAFRNGVQKGNFDFNALYALNPFDNHIILCEISGADLARFSSANTDKEIVYTKEYGFSIATDKTYTLAIIDYVYFGNYFAGYRTETYKDTNLVLRDLMAEDLRLHKSTGFDIYKDSKNVFISCFVSE